MTNQALVGRVKAIMVAFASLAFATSHLNAQDVETFDPDEAYSEAGDVGGIDADLTQPVLSSAPSVTPSVEAPEVAPPLDDSQGIAGDAYPVDDAAGEANVFDQEFAQYDGETVLDDTAPGDPVSEETVAVAERSDTYGEDDLIGAAEGVFGKGAEGLAKLIQDLLRDQGEPNGYIVGREAGGAFIIGARYGSGTLYHKVEGERKVYWTGPSIGFDAGANAGNTFVLVYNLFDTEELYERYPAGEGQAYLIGGMHASYMRKGDVVLIPIRVGAGLRLGVNAGYMKFSKKQRWLPF